MWPSETFNFLRSEIGWRSEQFAGAGAKLQALRAALRTHKSLEPMRRNWPRVLCLRRLRRLRHFKLFQPPRKIQKAPERSHQKFGAFDTLDSMVPYGHMVPDATEVLWASLVMGIWPRPYGSPISPACHGLPWLAMACHGFHFQFQQLWFSCSSYFLYRLW